MLLGRGNKSEYIRNKVDVQENLKCKTTNMVQCHWIKFLLQQTFIERQQFLLSMVQKMLTNKHLKYDPINRARSKTVCAGMVYRHLSSAWNHTATSFWPTAICSLCSARNLVSWLSGKSLKLLRPDAFPRRKMCQKCGPRWGSIRPPSWI